MSVLMKFERANLATTKKLYERKYMLSSARTFITLQKFWNTNNKSLVIKVKDFIESLIIVYLLCGIETFINETTRSVGRKVRICLKNSDN